LLTVDIQQETIGSIDNFDYFQIFLFPDITKHARESLCSFEQKDLVTKAEKLLLIIRNQITNFDNTNLFPVIRAFERDDNSILLEWIFESFRLGFSFEIDDNESSWYLVSDETSGNHSANGDLFVNKFTSLTKFLLGFVQYTFSFNI